MTSLAPLLRLSARRAYVSSTGTPWRRVLLLLSLPLPLRRRHAQQTCTPCRHSRPTATKTRLLLRFALPPWLILPIIPCGAEECTPCWACVVAFATSIPFENTDLLQINGASQGYVRRCRSLPKRALVLAGPCPHPRTPAHGHPPLSSCTVLSRRHRSSRQKKGSAAGRRHAAGSRNTRLCNTTPIVKNTHTHTLSLTHTIRTCECYRNGIQCVINALQSSTRAAQGVTRSVQCCSCAAGVCHVQ